MTRWRDARRILRALVVCGSAVCLLLPGAAAAALIAVVMSDDSAPYQDVYQAIRVPLHDAGHDIHRVYVDALSGSTLAEPRLVVAVGVRAAEAVASLPGRAPVLAVLVPRAWFFRSGRARLLEGGRRAVSAIFLDQPFERQARLIRMVFPDVRRVGVLLSMEQRGLVEELEDAFRPLRLNLSHALVGEDDGLMAPLEHVLNEADVLLAVPDPAIFNRDTAQSLFLTSYRYRDPVVGYSRSMTRAGALVSVYSTPAQIGRQAAETVSAALGYQPPRLPVPAYPVYFEVSVNEQVARSLGHALLPEPELEKRLGGQR